MRSQPDMQVARYPRLARMSRLSMFLLLLWASLAGAVVELLQGRIIGGLFLLVCGLLIVATMKAKRIASHFDSESRSASLPARVLIANVLVFLLSAVLTTVYLDELPLYMMSPDSQRTFILLGISALLAAGGLVANLVALRRDRAERSPL